MWSGLGVLLLSKFIAGAVNPAVIKLAVREFAPVFFIAIRFLIATLVLLPFYLRQKRKPSTLKEIKILSAFALLFFLNNIFYSNGISQTTIIMSEILYAMLPVFVILLSYFLRREKLTKYKIAGFVISSAGVAILLQQLFTVRAEHTFGTIIGNSLVLCAVISWSFYTVFSKPLTTIYSPVTTTFFSFGITSLLAFLLTPFSRLLSISGSSHIITIYSIGLLLLSVGAAIGNFFLYQFGIHKTTPVIASFFQYLSPFFALLTALPIFKEKVTFPFVIGGILVLAGVFYATTYSQVRKKFISN